MGFMNVYSHWLSPLSFVLALQVTTTSSTLHLVASLVVNPTFARTITSKVTICVNSVAIKEGKPHSGSVNLDHQRSLGLAVGRDGGMRR